MTDAQKRIRELRDRQSKERGRMAELSRADSLSDEQRGELDGIEIGTPDLERQIRAATVALEEEEREAQTTETDSPDAEMRERIELRGKARLVNYLMAASEGRVVSGAEAELRQAAGVEGVPLELFDLPRRQTEQRADAATTAPATGTGVNVDPVLPMIFARAVLPRMGVDMPRVGTGGYSTMTISAGLSAAAVDAGAAKESTAATLTAKTTTPHRVSARLSIRIEDVASVGVENFESSLRENLMLAMSDQLDKLGLTGDGQNANPQGLLPQLTDPTDPTAVVNFDAFVALAAGGIDGGPWAETMREVRLLVNAEAMRKAETTFQAATNYKGEMAAAAYLRSNSSGFFSSSRMPATDSTIAQCIRYRAGTMGMDGVNAARTATCPVWNHLGIDDIFSDSASGTRHFTLHALIGDVLITQASAYERVDLKLS